MSLATFSSIRVILAAFFCGLAIKVMDDCIDADYDKALGLPNLSNRFGSGVVAYGMLLLLLACVSNVSLTVALFTAAYAVGMGLTDNTLYPTGLKGKVEVLVAVVIGLCVAGLRLTVLGLSIMVAAQLIDTWVDEHKGLHYLVAALVFACLAALCSWELTLLVLFSYALFFALERWWQWRLQ